MQRWFCSDHHLGHQKIIEYCRRPFKDIQEMGARLLELHNERVAPEDHVYFLGDVTMRRGGRQDQEWFINELRKYNGHKRLFLGNHDHFPVEVYLRAGFEKVLATWRDDQGILYSHFPLHPASLGSAIANVHGHTHTDQGASYPPIEGLDRHRKPIVKPYVNICVEQTNYRPINFDELMARIEAARLAEPLLLP